MRTNFPDKVMELSIELNGTIIVIGKYERQVDISRAIRLLTENNCINLKYHIETITNPKLIDIKLKNLVY